jgi:hypothetical protein
MPSHHSIELARDIAELELVEIRAELLRKRIAMRRDGGIIPAWTIKPNELSD